MGSPRPPKIVISMLNWNQAEVTLRCLETVRRINYPNLQTVVVDNASRDGSAEKIQAAFPEVTVVRNSYNAGCAGGRNIAINYFLKQTDGDYFFSVDNDFLFNDPEILNELVRVAEKDPKIGVVGPYVYFYREPEKLYAAGGGYFNSLRGEFFDIGRGEESEEKYRHERIVDSVPGGMSFAKREVCERVPDIDERYLIYFEDPDWCFRVRKAGYKLTTAPKARVWHDVSSSLGFGSPTFYYYRSRNRLLFMWKNVSKAAFFAFLPYFIWDFSYGTLWTLYRANQKEQFRAAVLGAFDFLRQRFGVREFSKEFLSRPLCVTALMRLKARLFGPEKKDK